MMGRYGGGVVPILVAVLMMLMTNLVVESRTLLVENNINIVSEEEEEEYLGTNGRRWAVLVAGSRGYDNYRHQADICHAYQILRKGGLKEENIIVFMYDDIAFNVENPRPGTIINKPNGQDVYAGVPKDYTGENCTAENFLAVILGNKSALSGGSGKVVDSGPDDRIFIYYADHGAAGVVGMPAGQDLYAKDLIQALKKKHEARAYKSMVFYLEACESGSMFEGLLPRNWSIYAITAANGEESSYAFYCPDDYPSPPSQYITCLGDIFSISWLEDSDLHYSGNETVGQQYKVIRRRTGYDYPLYSSHVMQFGDKKLRDDFLSVYMGATRLSTIPAAVAPNGDTFNIINHHHSRALTQAQASLVYFSQKYKRAAKGSDEEVEARRKLRDVEDGMGRVDGSMRHILRTLFGPNKNATEAFINLVRPTGQPLVDDWDRFKSLVRTYEEQCGRLSWYGRNYIRGIANLCNAGLTPHQMAAASAQACKSF
ncbi:hypothetical protein Tsubulata_023781 [Turnera subulata]|uniref:Legumain prodomain domain-containing protein n=1 Tax=Turnera subulata TaxID=218843 RepID=A0A9Q0F9E9_9ROSI|nr:hypothetical protein Tsubulata_023781 [Turnera subulata]